MRCKGNLDVKIFTVVVVLSLLYLAFKSRTLNTCLKEAQGETPEAKVNKLLIYKHEKQHNIHLPHKSVNPQPRIREDLAEQTRIANENRNKPVDGLKIVYRDFSRCKDPKPLYLKQYRAHCWQSCTDKCNTENNTRIYCFPNLQLIGMRKCGSTDFSKWFRKHPQTKFLQQGYWPKSDIPCPMEYFSQVRQAIPNDGFSSYNGGPGNIVIFKALRGNATHLQVVTAPQLLGFMATPDTKFYIQLRNPTDRAISYLFHWHSLHLVFTNMTLEQMDGPFVDRFMRENCARLKSCISKKGELGCFYMTRSYDGNLDSILLHSLYITMVEETLKFIPRDQIMFKTTSEYSTNQVSTVKEVSEKFFNLTFPTEMASSLSSKKYNSNARNKNPVLASTLEYLDKFFEPYNRRLANLLGDDKWLFKVNRTLQNPE